jgi:acylphosphatase
VAAGGRKAVRLRIEGRVQGVGFRAWVEQTARGIGLDGWVRNRRDGGVEVSIAGPVSAVDDMVRRCERGPPSARVDMLKVLDEPEPCDSGFAVRATI